MDTADPPLLTVNPIAKQKVKDAESSAQPCLPEQVEKLLKDACQDHEAVIFAVMAYLGLRFGEVRDLMWSDFNFDQGKFGWVNIQRGGSDDTTKGQTSRRIPVNEALRKALDTLPRGEGGRIFSQRASTHYPNGDRPLNERRLLMSLKRLCKRCKFDNPKQYKLHTFRHAFASMLAKSNVSYKYALEFMGHKDSKILDLYYKMFDKTAELAMASIRYEKETAA